jgi:hypothetical protein
VVFAAVFTAVFVFDPCAVWKSCPTFLDAFPNGLPASRTHLPFDGAADVVAAVEPFRLCFRP